MACFSLANWFWTTTKKNFQLRVTFLPQNVQLSRKKHRGSSLGFCFFSFHLKYQNLKQKYSLMLSSYSPMLRGVLEVNFHWSHIIHMLSYDTVHAIFFILICKFDDYKNQMTCPRFAHDARQYFKLSIYVSWKTQERFDIFSLQNYRPPSCYYSSYTEFAIFKEQHDWFW